VVVDDAVRLVERPPLELVRFESPAANARGRHPGVFALANGLARAGRLSPADHAWWRHSNDWCNAAYTDPSTIDAAVYDDLVDPGAQGWFKSTAASLIAMAREYVALLERYDVTSVERRTDVPGRVVYEDDVQVVAVPTG